MRIYVGQTRSAALVRHLWGLGIGECTVRGELPPRRHPWFFDNGAYRDWKSGNGFLAEEFLADIESIYRALDRPDFIVLPDIVAGGRASLDFSAQWIHRCRGLAPLYLAVQDGMTQSDVHDLAPHLAGLFVGGTLDWKIETGADWVRTADALGLRCHVGRCGSMDRIGWARRIGASSIDSALPLWSEDNLDRFLRALGPQSQHELFTMAVAS